MKDTVVASYIIRLADTAVEAQNRALILSRDKQWARFGVRIIRCDRMETPKSWLVQVEGACDPKKANHWGY